MYISDTSKKRIYLIFFLSGIGGLIYETVWLRILIRILGCTVYATSIILGAFMAGLALGSFLIGRWAQKQPNQLRLYAFLELGIGFSALSSLFIFPNLTPLYKFFFSIAQENRIFLMVVQSSASFIILLVPTFLMGGTLPVISSYMKAHESVFPVRIGFLYGLNTLGAVIGVLGSGFFSIGTLGEFSSVLIGVILNLLVFIVAYNSSKLKSEIATETKSEKSMDSLQYADSHISLYDETTRRAVLIVYSISGFVAISYEIIWTRMLQIQSGTSIYAFSLILAFYLIGIGVGSILGGKYISKIKDHLLLFNIFQIGIACYSIIGLYIFSSIGNPTTSELNIFSMAYIPFILVIPITIILGMMFPLVSQIYVKDENNVATSIGRLYAVNTLGCIVGSIVCGFVFIALLGTRNTILLLATMNILISLSVAISNHSWLTKKIAFIFSLLIIATLALGIYSPDPFYTSILRKIDIDKKAFRSELEFLYNKESVAATTTAIGFKRDPLLKQLLINGIGMTHLCIEAKLMAHLPLLLHPQPNNMLIICFGMGTALRSAWTHKYLHTDVVELVPETYEYYKLFHKNGPAVLADPRIRHYVDDGRNFLQMRSVKYDVISLDPAPPLWSTGTVNLYSAEFFQLAKTKLKPGGILCVWIPPAPFTEVSMILKTFQSIFPNTHVWRGPYYPGFYLIGLENDKKLDMSRFQKENSNTDVLSDLNEWNKIPNIESLKKLYILTPKQLSLLVEGVDIITDDTPYTEFPLWRKYFNDLYKYHLNAIIAAKIVKQIEAKK